MLLIDQNPQTAGLTAEMLRTSGPEGLVLTRAEQLKDATQELLEYGASCVVLALRSTDGLASLEQLRTSAPDVPVLVLSDRADDALALDAIRAGAQDYLVGSEVNATLLRRAVRYAIERNRAELQLAQRALHDPLTTLPNRALFLDRLSVALDRSRRTGASVAVLFLDIDDFKQVNDSLGHAAGDRLLEQLAHRLRSMLRPMDTVARFGGDEFTFLFEELSSEREALLIAERISRAAELPVPGPEAEMRITVSIGITLVRDPASAPETVIREADAAMYRAKELGPPRYELFDQTARERATRRIERETALRRALEGSELRVLYAPRVSLRGEARVVGFQALVRWQHPERGLVGPEEFMPLAEESGLAVPIGQYLAAEALRAQLRWRELGHDLTISISLSPRQLEDVGLLSTLTAADPGPTSVNVEVGQAGVTERLAAVLPVLEGLRAAGVGLTLADFGTGDSSIQSLMRLPVAVLKLHESFIQSLEREPHRQPLLAAMVALAHALRRTALADGVQSEAQLERVRAAGCDGAQGILFGAPVTAEEAATLVPRPVGG